METSSELGVTQCGSLAFQGRILPSSAGPKCRSLISSFTESNTKQPPITPLSAIQAPPNTSLRPPSADLKASSWSRLHLIRLLNHHYIKDDNLDLYRIRFQCRPRLQDPTVRIALVYQCIPGAGALGPPRRYVSWRLGLLVLFTVF